jgi:hypothetical protein
MIANAKWFNPRKYGGWGVTPNCWQGWLYLVIVSIPIMIIPNLKLTGWVGTGLMTVWGVIFTLDVVDIMRKIKRDERDMAHEAIAERNAMWFVIVSLTMGIAYQAAMGIINNSNQIDPVILVAVIGAMLVKGGTHWYLRDK